jgi:hypothetical protein
LFSDGPAVDGEGDVVRFGEGMASIQSGFSERFAIRRVQLVIGAEFEIFGKCRLDD